jgi:hypothetical protein
MREQVSRLVRMLGRSLAVLYFEVGCDARDVEFVFGGVPTRSRTIGADDGDQEVKDADEDKGIAGFEQEDEATLPMPVKEQQHEEEPEENIFTLFNEDVAIWLLDFNQVRVLPDLANLSATNPENRVE